MQTAALPRNSNAASGFNDEGEADEDLVSMDPA